MLIEKASLADINELSELLAMLFHQEVEFTPDYHKQARALQAIIANPAIGLILVARHNGKLVGMVSLLFSISTALGGRVAWLEDMIILPTERGKGIGSSLLNAAISTAHDCACLRITLLTDSNNQAAQQFYKKHAFVQSSMLPFRHD